MSITLRKTTTPLTVRAADLRLDMHVTDLGHPGVWRVEWLHDYSDGDGRPRRIVSLADDRTGTAWDLTVDVDDRIRVATLSESREQVR